jgi:outer membrane protein assembly factor BamB
LVAVLQSLTNTDQGVYYPRWAKWWEENRKFAQRRWDLDGFVALGLHAVEPVDEQFAIELMDVLGTSKRDDRNYHWFSARRLLASTPPGKRLAWVTRAAASEQKSRRSGALDILRSMETAGDEVLIRKLAVDADTETRRGALSILNDRQQVSRSVGSKNTRVACYVETHRTGLLELQSILFAGDSLIVADGDKVTAFDPRTRRTLWTKTIPEMGENALVIGKQIVFDSWKADLFALDERGNIVWRMSSVGGENNQVQRLLKLGDDIVVVRQRAVEQLDAKTGKIKYRAEAEGEIKDADGTNTSVYFVDGSGLHSLNGKSGRERIFKDARGISVSEKAICITTGTAETDSRITCLNADNLTEQWSQSTKDKQPKAPIQDRAKVFVSAQNSLTAFNASDGSLLWTTEDASLSRSEIVATQYGLLISGSPMLKILDPQTGEVRRIWPEILGARLIAVHGRFAAIATGFGSGILWLVDLEQER